MNTPFITRTTIYLVLSILVCLTTCSCRGKGGAKVIEVVEKSMKSGADDALKLGVKGINEAIQEDDKDYSIDVSEDYYDTNEPKGQFVVSEESGDLIYIDEYGKVHQALLDENGNPYIVE